MHSGALWTLLVLCSAAAAAELSRDPALLGKGHRSLLGVKQPAHRACGTDHDKPLASVQAAMAANPRQPNDSEVSAAAAGAIPVFPLSGLQLPIVFHVVQWQGYSSLTDLGTPPVSNQQIQDQVAVLNKDYAGSGLQFKQPSIRFYSNKDWAGDCWNRLGEILVAINLAPAAAVNILVCDLSSSGGVLGIMPDMPNGRNELDPSQAVVMDYRTLPGGPYLHYSQGRTATHELGHFFGLQHVFGSCSSANGGIDGIADTPAQLTATQGCPASKDSCPTESGLDAITNFMDYSWDDCMTGFSADQIARIQDAMTRFRPRLLRAGLAMGALQLNPGSMPPPPRRQPPSPPVTQLNSTPPLGAAGPNTGSNSLTTGSGQQPGGGLSSLAVGKQKQLPPPPRKRHLPPPRPRPHTPKRQQPSPKAVRRPPQPSATAN